MQSSLPPTRGALVAWRLVEAKRRTFSIAQLPENIPRTNLQIRVLKLPFSSATARVLFAIAFWLTRNCARFCRVRNAEAIQHRRGNAKHCRVAGARAYARVFHLGGDPCRSKIDIVRAERRRSRAV